MKVHQLQALKDNYVYLLHVEESETTAVVDPSTSKEVLQALKTHNWKLDYVLNTHHHWDHTGGNLELKQATGCKIVGFEPDAARIPGIDIKLKAGQTFSLGKAKAEVLFIPGHTLGHIAFYFKEEKALFCGDTLFSLGCGRLFEGSPEQMFNSLKVLKTLPDDVCVYCGHEYTKRNAEFSHELFPAEKEYEVALSRKVPSLLGYEKKWNPFLRASSAQQFAEYRLMKDNF